MSTSTSGAKKKQQLKEARQLLDRQSYAEAIKVCDRILLFGSDYAALVFKGLALGKLSKYDDAIECYNRAIELDEGNVLAYQGLYAIYESSKMLEKLFEVVVKVVDLLDDDKATSKALEFIDFVKTQGDSSQVIRAQEMTLPGGEFYDRLGDYFGDPGVIYEDIIERIRVKERTMANAEVAKRRMRISAVREDITGAVDWQLMSASRLPELYRQAINYTRDDERRYMLEKALLAYEWRLLLIAPKDRKREYKESVYNLALGHVIIRLDNLLAWNIMWEWKDFGTIEELDFEFLNAYARLFDNGFSRMLKSFLHYTKKFQPEGKDDKETEETGKESEESEKKRSEHIEIALDDLQDTVLNVLNEANSFTHWLNLWIYREYSDSESIVEASSTALEYLTKVETDQCISLEKLRNACIIIRVVGLRKYQAPRHVPEAQELIEQVLSNDPSIEASYTKALLELDAGEYSTSLALLEDILLKDSDFTDASILKAWVLIRLGKYEQGRNLCKTVCQVLEEERPPAHGKIAVMYWRIGFSIWNEESYEDKADAYKAFSQCLKRDPFYAHAYTSLGLFFDEYVQDSDRAQKAFQKALELDHEQVVAAHHLAEMFANRREWELVEVVCRQTMKFGGIDEIYGMDTVWASKALAFVEIQRRNYSRVITLLQTVLRHDPSDMNSWTALGEAYLRSGRFDAAERALKRVNGNNVEWHSRYLLSEVQIARGEIEEAFETLETLKAELSKDALVSVSYCNIMLQFAKASIEQGFIEKGSDYLHRCINECLSNERSPTKFTIMGNCFLELAKLGHEINPQIRKSTDDEFQLTCHKERDEDDFHYYGEKDFESLIAHTPISLLNTWRLAINTFFHVVCIVDPLNEKARLSAGWFNLGISFALLSQRFAGKLLFDANSAALKCFSSAIQLESRNSDFWNSWAISRSFSNHKLSERAFTRALQIERRDVKVWTNLALLYTLHGDTALAREATEKAQAIDVWNPGPWLQQALLFELEADEEQAMEIYRHTYEVLRSTEPHVALRHVEYTFSELLRKDDLENVQQRLLSCIYIMRKLVSKGEKDHLILYLYAQVLDFAGQNKEAMDALALLISRIEDEFEYSEKRSLIEVFCHAHFSVCRLSLNQGNYEAAKESAETCLSLVEEITAPATRTRLLVGATVFAGIAEYLSGNRDMASEMFERAIEAANGQHHAALSLAYEYLWYSGQRNKALSYFDKIAEEENGIGIAIIHTAMTYKVHGSLSEHLLYDKHGAVRVMRNRSVRQFIQLLQSVGDQEWTQKNWQRCLFLHPSSAAAWSNIGQWTGCMGMKQVAIKLSFAHMELDMADFASILKSVALDKWVQTVKFLAPWQNSAVQ